MSMAPARQCLPDDGRTLLRYVFGGLQSFPHSVSVAMSLSQVSIAELHNFSGPYEEAILFALERAKQPTLRHAPSQCSLIGFIAKVQITREEVLTFQSRR